MTTETDNKEILPVIETPITYTLETLPKLLPQQQLMLTHILNGNNYTDAYRMAGYSSDEYADRSAWVLVTRNPLKAHLEYFRAEMAKLITPQYLMTKLDAIVQNTIKSDDYRLNAPDTAIKAIDVINKMQGNYAKNEGITINNLNTSLEDIRNARSEYKKDK